MSRLKALGYLLAFITPALMPVSAWLAVHTAQPNLATWFPLFFLFVLLPLADYAIGRDASNPDAAEAERLDRGLWFRGLTLICLPLQLALVYWSCGQFQNLPLAWNGQLGWLLSQGVVSGVLAINVAHELIHKSSKLEPLVGGLLLCSVNYAGFKVEHVRGHHLHVSTPADASSARFDETVYPFVVRALFKNTRNAWRLEAERLRKLGLSAWHWRNELIGWSLVTLAFALIVGVAWGPLGTAFFLAQGLAPERLLFERASRNTAENAALSLALVQPGEDETWVLVTSAFHMPRSLASFEAAGWTGLVPYPVDYRSGGFGDGIGWDLARNLLTLNTAVREYIGLVAYRVTGR